MGSLRGEDSSQQTGAPCCSLEEGGGVCKRRVPTRAFPPNTQGPEWAVCAKLKGPGLVRVQSGCLSAWRPPPPEGLMLREGPTNAPRCHAGLPLCRAGGTWPFHPLLPTSPRASPCSHSSRPWCLGPDTQAAWQHTSCALGWSYSTQHRPESAPFWGENAPPDQTLGWSHQIITLGWNAKSPTPRLGRLRVRRSTFLSSSTVFSRWGHSSGLWRGVGGQTRQRSWKRGRRCYCCFRWWQWRGGGRERGHKSRVQGFSKVRWSCGLRLWDSQAPPAQGILRGRGGSVGALCVHSQSASLGVWVNSSFGINTFVYLLGGSTSHHAAVKTSFWQQGVGTKTDISIDGTNDQRNKTEARNKPTHLWSISLRQRSQEYTVREGRLFSKWGEAGQPHVNQWS